MIPVWLEQARRYEGLREYRGSDHNPKIIEWMTIAGRAGWVTSDETPWCGGFAAGMLYETGHGGAIPNLPVRARNWLNLPNRLSGPRVGAIVVFPRGNGGGHVAFVDHFDATWLYCLGGNQQNQVCVSRFRRRQAIGYFWPVAEETPSTMPDKSRIARAARRQKIDAAKGTGAIGTTNVDTHSLDATDFDLDSIRGPIDRMLDNAAWAKSVAYALGDFAGFVGTHWLWVALPVAGYFGLRMLWDSHLISKFRTDDHNSGFARSKEGAT